MLISPLRVTWEVGSRAGVLGQQVTPGVGLSYQEIQRSPPEEGGEDAAAWLQVSSFLYLLQGLSQLQSVTFRSL